MTLTREKQLRYLPDNFERKTRRLIIRPYRLEDYSIWKETQLNMSSLESRSANKKRPSPKEVSPSMFKEILKEQKRLREIDNFYVLAIFEKKSNLLIGYVNIMAIMRGMWQKADLGYLLFGPYQKRGYGREMTKAGIEIAFKTIRLHRLEAVISSKNRRSINLAKSVGFKREGIRKKYLFTNGNWEDFAIYSIIPEDLGINVPSPIIEKSKPRN